MYEPGVGNLGQPALRVGVVERNGLFGKVPRGHDQWAIGLGKQQVVQRRIGEQETDHWVLGRHLGGEAGIAFALHQHDRSLDRGEQRPLRVVEHGQRLGSAQIAHHHGKGFLVALLAFAQAAHRRR